MTPRETLLAAARVCRDRADACGTSPAERIAHHEGMACADAILALAEQQPAEFFGIDLAAPGGDHTVETNLLTGDVTETLPDPAGQASDPARDGPELVRCSQPALPGPDYERPVALSDALLILLSRHRKIFSVAEVRKLQRAIRALGPDSVSVPREPTEAMIDAPRQIILYAETRGRTLQGLREHLDLAGVEFHSWFPEWAITERGHLTKGAIADLIYRAMLAAGSAK